MRRLLLPIFLTILMGCASEQIVTTVNEAPRFTATARHTICDKLTGLEWHVGPDKKTFIADAQSYVKMLRAASHEDWRLPTMHELREIRLPGVGEKNLDPLFQTRGEMVWSGDRCIFGYPYIRLVDGSTGWDTRGVRKHGFRVFAVRKFR